MSGLIFLSDRPSPPKGQVRTLTQSLEELAKARNVDAQMFLVDAYDPDFTERALATVRQHTYPSVYLQPVVLVGDEDAIPKRALNAADRVISRDMLTDFGVQKLRDIFAPWFNRLVSILSAEVMDKAKDEGSVTASDTALAVKILRYLYVRRVNLKPVRGVWSMHGFHYPPISYFLDSQDVSIYKVLDFMEGQALLESEFMERAHFCARCRSAFLNFREICQHCKSPHLAVDDLMHHFRCGHVAPEPEFHVRGELRCPKCSRELNHLGTDYDKPSIVYTCQDCGHVSQEPDISAVCYNCEHSAAPEEHIHRDVKRYTLTSLGENAAVFGLDSLFREILTEKVHVVSMETFKTMGEIELNRIERYKKSESSAIYFYIANLATMQVNLGNRAREIFDEISNVVAQTLRSSDIIAPLNDSTYLSLLMETPLAGAQIATKRLSENMSELLSANLDVDVEIRTHAFGLDPQKTIDEIMAEIMSHLNA